MAQKPQVMILGTGRAVPEKILTNADLEKMVDTSDEWIVARTGIRQRHVAEPGSALSDLVTEAARKALDDAGLSADQIDLIVLATVTGDMKFPSTACLVQEKLGAKNAVAFDLSAACAGFLYGLQVAEGMMAVAGYRHALVIGGEVLTSMVDWQDRDTCVLFGDGAGAVVLGPAEGERGLLQTCLGSNGEHAGLLYNPGGGCVNPPNAETVAANLYAIRMEGREVFRHAVVAMADVLQQALEKQGLSGEDIDLLIPHQANLRIIEAVAKRFKLPMEKVCVNVDRYGNTSAASIPIALDELRRGDGLQPGTLVGMVSFGAGLTWAAALVRV
ncbi:beta-ketoacyl-ACP synthase III [Geothermobacter hydrogeniphilus]|uniref:Beta-ketoacyl-[acyl-carrier-protein] synthase III n=1 Tax=Geothermobacter hydrogeniphilus TaxID=1969733 RepID=A0A1X0Y077_9BACT|nr:beta-ketoacyl-ACP synthase III [Geothermobacter hydrogeniphilus]ORJ58611.1 3-oxoacyl-ACP synthase [Geothermobacter hydrogeniphilus]